MEQLVDQLRHRAAAAAVAHIDGAVLQIEPAGEAARRARPTRWPVGRAPITVTRALAGIVAGALPRPIIRGSIGTGGHQAPTAAS
jgi:hypothetical protein